MKKIKCFVNLITLLSFVATAITVIALKFLPSGVRQAGQQEFLGITRHEWSGIHGFAGTVMIIFTLIHIIIYWKVFAAMTKSMFRKQEDDQINKEIN